MIRKPKHLVPKTPHIKPKPKKPSREERLDAIMDQLEDFEDEDLAEITFAILDNFEDEDRAQVLQGYLETYCFDCGYEYSENDNVEEHRESKCKALKGKPDEGGDENEPEFENDEDDGEDEEDDAESNDDGDDDGNDGDSDGDGDE